MNSKEAVDHLSVALGRMDALLVRLEAAVDSLSRGPGGGSVSDAPVDKEAEEKRIDAIIAKLRYPEAAADYE